MKLIDMSLAASLGAIAFYLLGFQQQLRRVNDDLPSNYAPLITLAAVLCHAYASFALINVTGGVDIGLLSVCNLVAFVMVSIVAVTSLRMPVENLFLFLFPISIGTLTAANLIDTGAAPLDNISPALLAHILISLAAYSTLMMAACQSALLAIQERALKNLSSKLHHFLPPLETMERLLLTMIWVGLILLSSAILSGWWFLDITQQVMHHMVLTSLSWLAYATFLGGHYVFGWRGLTAVRWTLVAFALLVLGYLGSKFVLEYVLTR